MEGNTREGTRTGREDGTRERPDRAPWRGAALWFAAAALLRFLFLGRPSLWGDEVFSLDDALALFGPEMEAGQFGYPLFYLLERVVLEACGLAGEPAPDPQRLQLALRVVPALAGAAAAGAAFLAPRGVLSRAERHALAALVAFSPWLLYFSQFARFYTLLVAICLPATFALQRALRERSARRGAAAAGLLLLAMLAHPAALLLWFGAVAAELVAAAARVRPLSRAIAPVAALPLLLVIPLAIWPAAVIESIGYKLTVQDAGVESPAGLALGIGFNVGPVVAALALLGVPAVWRRDRALGIHVVVGAGAPAALLFVLAFLGRSVEQRYLLAVLPLALVPAAVLLRELAERVGGAGGAPRLAAPAAALAAWLPGVLSQYADGNRHDLAGAVAFVRERLEPGDGVICETHALARRYFAGDLAESRLLEAPPPPDDWEQYLRMWDECATIWVIVPAEFAAMSPQHASFLEWAWSQGRLVHERWRPRLDYHQNRLRVFRIETERVRRWTRELPPPPD